ncbi:hypothetical protein ACFV2H_52665 [Streptomyces sp. NPDC059629]|uniref:hypothetical protein n=1 Tax=Streptomyces sp. NPDC059629 TaxID=3346889 RepID=UPI0036B9A81D
MSKDGSRIDITLASGRVVHGPARLFAKAKARMLADRRARSASPSVTPHTTLPGDCGSSFVAIGYQNSAAKPYLMNTGFTLYDEPAVSYDWWVQIDGPGGYYYSYESSGGLAERWSWSGSHTGTGSFGRWSAMVDTQSWAVTTTGGVCSSLGPTDSHSL